MNAYPQQEEEALLGDILRGSVPSASAAEIAGTFERILYPAIIHREKEGTAPDFSIAVVDDGIFHVFANKRWRAGQNHLLIAYWKPQALSSPTLQADACRQVEHYLYEQAGSRRIGCFDAILTDGTQIAYFSHHGGAVRHTSAKPLGLVDIGMMMSAIASSGSKKLHPANLVQDFGITSKESSETKRLVRLLYQELISNSSARAEMLFCRWKEQMHLTTAAESRSRDVEKRRADLSRILEESVPDAESEFRAIFALQTCYAQVLKMIACKCGAALSGEMELFEWSQDEAVLLQLKKLGERLNQYSVFSLDVVYEPVDIFQDLYMGIVPQSVRHAMGEYFTPGWLADRVVSEALPLLGKSEWNAIDPCCGSGSFLLTLIRKIVGSRAIHTLSAEDGKSLQQAILSRVHGMDINPISVLTARVNYYLAVSSLGRVDAAEIPVCCGDSTEGNHAGSYDLIVGNPPWVKWENLPPAYRSKLVATCQHQHIFCNDGCMYGGAPLNLCTMVARTTAANWLSREGILAFLMPDSLMSQNSYDEFRDFYVNETRTERLYLQKLDRWMPPLRPFKLGHYAVKQDFNTYYYGFRKQDYCCGISVAEITKRAGVKDENLSRCSTFDAALPFLSLRHGAARQFAPGSTAFTYVSASLDFSVIIGESDYLYRTGVESSPCEVFKLEGIGASENPHHYRFRNKILRHSRLKVTNAPPEGWDFPVEYIYPMLEGPRITPFEFDCADSFHLVPYIQIRTNRPVSMTKLVNTQPEIASYLELQRPVLARQSKKSQAMHQGMAFYSLSKIGPYTFAPVMVAARDNTSFCAAVVRPVLTPWGEWKQTICVKHTIIISQDKDKRFITEDEAHYINGVLNSSIVVHYIHSTFKTNGFSLNKSHLFLPKFQPEDSLFTAIADLSREATLHPEKRTGAADALTTAYLALCRSLKG